MLRHYLPPARNSRSQTGTPGPSRTQSVAGSHRVSALYTVRRVPLFAPLTASPAVPSRVHLSSAEMGVLAEHNKHCDSKVHLPAHPTLSQVDLLDVLDLLTRKPSRKYCVRFKTGSVCRNGVDSSSTGGCRTSRVCGIMGVL